MTVCQHPAIITLDAGHDRNGNPRRALVCIACQKATDEGYRGDDPDRLRAEFGPNASHSGRRYRTTPAEYRETLRRSR